MLPLFLWEEIRREIHNTHVYELDVVQVVSSEARRSSNDKGRVECNAKHLDSFTRLAHMYTSNELEEKKLSLLRSSPFIAYRITHDLDAHVHDDLALRVVVVAHEGVVPQHALRITPSAAHFYTGLATATME